MLRWDATATCLSYDKLWRCWARPWCLTRAPWAETCAQPRRPATPCHRCTSWTPMSSCARGELAAAWPSPWLAWRRSSTWTGDGLVRRARLAWGSVGSTVLRVPVAEEALAGRPLTRTSLEEAVRDAAAPSTTCASALTTAARWPATCYCAWPRLRPIIPAARPRPTRAII